MGRKRRRASRPQRSGSPAFIPRSPSPAPSPTQVWRRTNRCRRRKAPSDRNTPARPNLRRHPGHMTVLGLGPIAPHHPVCRQWRRRALAKAEARPRWHTVPRRAIGPGSALRSARGDGRAKGARSARTQSSAGHTCLMRSGSPAFIPKSPSPAPAQTHKLGAALSSADIANQLASGTPRMPRGRRAERGSLSALATETHRPAKPSVVTPAREPGPIAPHRAVCRRWRRGRKRALRWQGPAPRSCLDS
ncbi:hypothetical protein M2319_002238 [Rhodobium gokarnense]|uniref:Uncharacterized protein n=1 Tax=Rhodobium gokarnense TaxID=364296 RepID=A0ABT3HBY2_9HYPH|nr:hypothetical protein [Rhodobium gokarnense]